MFFTQHNSPTQFFLHGFGAIGLTSLYPNNYKKFLNVLFVEVYRNYTILFSVSLVLAKAIQCQYLYVAHWVTLPVTFTVSLDWLKFFWRLSLSRLFWLVGNSSLPILVETHKRPYLPCYFACQIYSLPSLVEVVLTALAELFCLSEFIVSICFVETIRRPLPSCFSWKNCGLPNRWSKLFFRLSLSYLTCLNS
jgi:hypothetical protein